MEKTDDEIIIYSQTPKCVLSFRPLLKFWEKEAATNEVYASAYTYLKEKLKEAPELLEPIEDFSLLVKYEKLIEQMLSVCLGVGVKKNEYYAAVYVDKLESFYETPAFKKLAPLDHQMNFSCFNQNCCLTPDGRTVAVYATLLAMFYGLNVSYEYPIIYTKKDEKTGLERHYKIKILPWFFEVKPKDNLKPLTDAEKKILFENLDDPKILNEIVPPDNFDVEGFMLFNASEITDHETLSSLKFDLIGKETLLSPQKFEILQHKLRVLLKKPNITLGLIAFPTDNKDMKNALKMGSSIVLHEDILNKGIVPDCEIYREVIEKQEIRIIYDLEEFTCSLNIEKELLKAGVRNLLLAPLIYKDELIGILEVASSVPGDLNKVNILKLKDVYPLFAICIESSLDDLNKSVQSVIKEKCTAIHPSVEWRFRKAAFRYLKNIRTGSQEEMEDIIFENVQPFYGCSDVKDSSLHRNNAVQADLIENLNLAKEIISKAAQLEVMPILEELSFRTSGHIDHINNGFSSSNEANVINFIRNEMGSTFDYLTDLNADLKNLIKDYRKNLDPKHGFLFRRRKEFEDSVALINETICAELDAQQEKAQKIFPHYFEKYKTDGVEYNMYIGDSLSAEGNFNKMHYKSLRLWQLETMCKIAKKCAGLKNDLAVPLELTHLIFIQNAPMSIKFLYDEKKFDVAGSYDIRHEIIKKRIDKAMIKNCNDRLVCPMKIAIVYSLESEAEEYKQYINFLKTKKYITDELESFEIEDMQGVHGLKALRITLESGVCGILDVRC